MQASTLQISIARPWAAVCEFLAQPRCYTAWASWIGPSLRQERGDWIVRRPPGRRAKVRFCERNAFGVADHWLLETEDRAVLVALRVLPRGDHSEVLLTVFREDGCSEAAWALRRETLQADLHRLRAAVSQAEREEPPPAGSRSARRSSPRIAPTATSHRPSAHNP
jgi:hypothetical protein